MKQILIRPSFHDWCKNRLFTEGTSFSAVYREAFSQWKEVAAREGYTLNTWDLVPLEKADVLWFLDLPPSRKEFERIRGNLKPGTAIILQVLESPTLSIHAFSRQNTLDFDAVLSYEHPITSNQNHSYFYYRLPNKPQFPATNPSYKQRRGLLLLNSNRVEGFWGMRQVGLPGVPGFGKLLSGWYCSPSMWTEVLSGELYSRRRRLARVAEQIAPDFLDIYGRGWQGEQISWCPLYRNRPYRCWQGPTQKTKQTLCENYRFVLSFENFRGQRGYISEKIFDPIFAGAVPVYMGDEFITDYVPSDAFVDARCFKDETELLKYLINCPLSEWQKMRDCGQAFLQSEEISPFTSGSFVETAMEVLRSVCR